MMSRMWWYPRAPDPKPIHIHEPLWPDLQSSPSPSSCCSCRSCRRSLSQFHNLLHASHHSDQLVHHRLELFAAALHPTDFVTHLCEHVIHLGLCVVHFLNFEAHVYVPLFEVDSSRDLARTDALTECKDALDVTLERRHLVTLRCNFARHQDRRECLCACTCDVRTFMRRGFNFGLARKGREHTFNSKCRWFRTF